MTVGVVTTSFPRWPGDFAGCFVEDAVRAILATGATVEVIAAGHGRAPDSVARDRHEPERPRVFRIPQAAFGQAPLFYAAGAPERLEQGGARTWAQAFFFWSALCERIRERVALGRWRRIQTHWLIPCALAARAAAPALPITAFAHSGDVALLERLPGGGALARTLARGIDDLAFVSADLQRRFAARAGFRTGRVAPAAHATRSAPEERNAARAALQVDGPTILSVGRLVPIKGFDLLLRAVARGCRDESRPPTVVILGDGPERERLSHLARALRVPLLLPGFVPRPDVARWMAAADVYVQPSLRLPNGRTEGLPRATLEARDAGLPVVASDSGGLAEISGLRTFPAGSVEALTTLLIAVRTA